MSRLLDSATAMQQRTAMSLDEYSRSRVAFARATAQLDEAIADLREMLLAGATELSKDAADCAILTVIAMHRGDEDAAASLARGCARAAQAAVSIVNEVYGVTVQPEPTGAADDRP